MSTAFNRVAVVFTFSAPVIVGAFFLLQHGVWANYAKALLIGG